MKKLFLFFALVFSLSSCLTVMSDEQEGLEQRTFYDVLELNDSTTIIMHCSVTWYDAEINFIKKRCTADTTYKVMYDKEYEFIKKNEIMVDNRYYEYTHKQFIEMLAVKNELPRAEKPYFMFKDGMYMSWRVFDEIYKTYIEEE